MDVSIAPVAPDERASLAALFQLYVYDFSDLMGLDVGNDGRFRAPQLDKVDADPRCEAFFIRADDKLAGFAIVVRRSRFTGDESVCDMDQFFVLRKYRRQTIGERAAAMLFDRFRGPWEVREQAENHGGIAFWRRAIGRYTSGRFQEVTLTDEPWRGPVQRFDSRG
jgi:predicted acetyltransferase